MAVRVAVRVVVKVGVSVGVVVNVAVKVGVTVGVAVSVGVNVRVGVCVNVCVSVGVVVAVGARVVVSVGVDVTDTVGVTVGVGVGVGTSIGRMIAFGPVPPIIIRFWVYSVLITTPDTIIYSVNGYKYNYQSNLILFFILDRTIRGLFLISFSHKHKNLYPIFWNCSFRWASRCHISSAVFFFPRLK